MKKSFYQFALAYRGGGKGDRHARFAEAMFHDHSFPKTSGDFDEISRYLEEKADADMPAAIFDELWNAYEER
ncbi:YozE family protein [Indiicoccus explosivorum]|uniref:YozE family protein n=1 Tax=Indiicoccus explosivorum TaxID=1917864 RepID=UPI000B44C8FF|nr:YozE family protein [Indiicoccus explosivorum]